VSSLKQSNVEREAFEPRIGVEPASTIERTGEVIER
jgi:hypothetical protein